MYDLKSISKSLQDAARGVLEAKKVVHPNQQKIDVHEPEKDEITSKDFEMLRAGKKAKSMKEEAELSETKSAPPGHHFTRSGQLKRGDADQDGPGGRMLRSDPKDKMRSKIPPVSESEVDYDELLVAAPIEVEIKEAYTFGDYLTAAKDIVGEQAAIELANYAFNKQDTNLFIEQITRSDIQSKIAAHTSAGHQVSEPKYKTKDGKLHAEYVVTDKETGIRRKYIHHGTARKVENMGAKGKRDEE
jgi:hypothetical protein